jgi:hypothetical protein
MAEEAAVRLAGMLFCFNSEIWELLYFGGRYTQNKGIGNLCFGIDNC